MELPPRPNLVGGCCSGRSIVDWKPDVRKAKDNDGTGTVLNMSTLLSLLFSF